MASPNVLLARATRCLKTAQGLRAEAAALDARQDAESAARRRQSATRLEDLAVDLQRQAAAATSPGPRDATGAWRAVPEDVG